MKLVELAKKTIELLKSAEDGILNLELAKWLEMPRRRIYDIVAILKAAKLVVTSREKSGTKIVWIGSNMSEIDPLSTSSDEPDELSRNQSSFNQTSPFQNTRTFPLSKSFSDSFERIVIDSPSLKIRTASKITRIKPIGVMELLVECDGPGFVIEAQQEDRKVKEIERAIVDAR